MASAPSPASAHIDTVAQIDITTDKPPPATPPSSEIIHKVMDGIRTKNYVMATRHSSQSKKIFTSGFILAKRAQSFGRGLNHF